MDDAIARYANQLGAGVIDPVTSLFCAIPFLALTGLVVGAPAVWTHDQRRHLLARMLVAALFFALCNEILLKHALGVFRVRPYIADPAIVAVGFRFTDSSFPSSHAASVAAAATILAHAHPRFAVVGVLAVLFMDFARVHNGMHYPSDVAVGTILGVAYGVLAIRLVERVATSLKRQREVK